jgi:hypothetical protein
MASKQFFFLMIISLLLFSPLGNEILGLTQMGPPIGPPVDCEELFGDPEDFFMPKPNDKEEVFLQGNKDGDPKYELFTPFNALLKVFLKPLETKKIY